MGTHSPGRDHDDGPDALAALADGTLPPRERAALEARVAASPELARRLQAQHRALAAVDALRHERAPAALRAAVAAAAPGAAGTVRAERPSRWGLAAGMAVVAAALALVVVFLLPNEVGGGTVIAQAAELHGLEAETGAPAERSRTLLALEVEGVAFPSYAAKFGWRASGRREDVVEGRAAVTVFYAKGGRRIGYTILAGPAVEVPSDTRRLRVEGTVVRTLEDSGRTVVTWRRQRHTCVMSAVGVPERELAELAGWKGRGTVTF